MISAAGGAFYYTIELAGPALPTNLPACQRASIGARRLLPQVWQLDSFCEVVVIDFIECGGGDWIITAMHA